MKKILILIPLLIGNLSFAQNEGVIEHYNQMISLLNLYSNNLENATKHYQSADQSLVSYKKHNKGVVSMLNAESSNDSQIKTLEETVLLLPEGLDNKDQIKAHLKAAISFMNKHRDLSELIASYVADKSYTSDNELKQFYAYMDTFQENASGVYDNCNNALALAADQTFKIELESLKQFPISVWIIPMKTDLKTAETLFGYLEKKDTKNVKLAIEKMNSTLAEHKSTEGKSTDLLKDYYYKSVYEDFYKKLDEFLGRVTRENPNMDYTSETFGEMIEKYNLFISQFN